MIKKITHSLLLFFMLIPVLVYASANSLARVGNNYYDSLAEAIANAGSNETITLISDVALDETLKINKTVNINLNGNDITAPSKVFEVQGGVLNLSGKGTIKETEPNYGAIMVKGSSDPNQRDYSIVNVGKDVTLEGWSGIFINHDSSNAYGVVVNLNGKINAVSDTSGGTGIGVYVNGNIKHQNNSPVVNVLDNAQINSNGNGIYMAGYSVFNIGTSNISGKESAIGIKSGELNIDGATITSNGKDYTPTEGYNNGMKASGTAIQIESNSGYAGNIGINIKNGTFKSKNSNVIYEYIGGGSSTQVNSINIADGTFISDADKDTLRFSDSFNDKHSNFITGGKFSSNPSSYLKSGYTTNVENDMYEVTKSAMKDIDTNNYNLTDDNDDDNDTHNNGFGKTLIITLAIAIIAIIFYLNRTKIFNFIKK